MVKSKRRRPVKRSSKWIFGTIFCLFVSSNSMAMDMIRITSAEWPPYQSEHLKHYGVASHIITQAFALEDIQVTYGFFPEMRSLLVARNGKWDATFLWVKTKEREPYFYFSDVIVENDNVFFHLKSVAFDWNTMDDLSDILIGATIGFSYGKAFDTAEKSGKIHVERVPSDEMNFAKLLKNRIQIFPQTKDVGYAMLQKNFSPEEAAQITHHPRPIVTEKLLLLFSKKVSANKERLILFNRGLKKLRDSGRYDQYIQESQRGEYRVITP